jgi:hypothetical protein
VKVRPKRGERYVVERPFEAIVLTHWRAPFTGGSEKTLPRGLEFIIAHDPPEKATAAKSDAAKPDEWEELLVDEADRSADNYDGYSLTIPFERLRLNCSRLA